MQIKEKFAAHMQRWLAGPYARAKKKMGENCSSDVKSCNAFWYIALVWLISPLPYVPLRGMDIFLFPYMYFLANAPHYSLEGRIVLLVLVIPYALLLILKLGSFLVLNETREKHKWLFVQEATFFIGVITSFGILLLLFLWGLSQLLGISMILLIVGLAVLSFVYVKVAPVLLIPPLVFVIRTLVKFVEWVKSHEAICPTIHVDQ